jgi:hypothetical protein
MIISRLVNKDIPRRWTTFALPDHFSPPDDRLSVPARRRALTRQNRLTRMTHRAVIRS